MDFYFLVLSHFSFLYLVTSRIIQWEKTCPPSETPTIREQELFLSLLMQEISKTASTRTQVCPWKAEPSPKPIKVYCTLQLLSVEVRASVFTLKFSSILCKYKCSIKILSSDNNSHFFFLIVSYSVNQPFLPFLLCFLLLWFQSSYFKK